MAKRPRREQSRSDGNPFAASLKGIAEAQATGKPSLASVPDVLGLMRAFVGAMAVRLGEVVRRRLSATECDTADLAACEQLARILRGDDPGWIAAPGWTGSPDGIEAWLRSRLAEFVEAEALESWGPYLALGLSLRHRLHHAFNHFKVTGGMPSNFGVLADLVDDGMRMALGIPSEAEFKASANTSIPSYGGASSDEHAQSSDGATRS